MAKKISAGTLRQTLRPHTLRKARSGGDGHEFPLRVARVTRVDPKMMRCALYTLTGNGDSYDDVPLTFPNAGARHFLGSIPELGDLCVIGYASGESGSTRVPYIMAWMVPGVAAGYDWLMTSPTSEQELHLTPAMQDTLEGSFGRRRHKLRQMGAGNIVGSSAQGADIVLDESVLLANRRGNEIQLRDQDQALIVRTLQQFHAGAGFRIYGGMIQRDGTLLPSQMISDGKDWNSDKQLGDDGLPLDSADLDGTDEDHGKLQPAAVFDNADLDGKLGHLNPSDILRRGLYVDDEGRAFDNLVVPAATYGGKPQFRVAQDSSSNGVTNPDVPVFTEYRIEVAHTSDGTLPVTEQTDGIDIDRLLPSAPDMGVDGSGDPNPANRSPNSPMVEFILGTAVGNDPVGDRSNYGRPLIASLFTKEGALSPGIRPADELTPVTEHAAFLLRVRNPADPRAADAFMAITKGGAFRSYFPGTGSKSQEEFYQTGKQVLLGADKDGQSLRTEGTGTLSFKNTGPGRPTDNVGVEIRSEAGAVEIYAGGSSSSGAGSGFSDQNLTPSGQQIGLLLKSARSLLIEAQGKTKISGKTVVIEDTDMLVGTANTAVRFSAGDVISMSSKVHSVTVTGRAEYTYGGPKDSLPTNGASRKTTFTATPLTGSLGGFEDEYEMTFGGRSEVFRMGRHETTINVGSYNIGAMQTALPSVGPGSGIHLSTGLPGVDNKLDLGLLSAELTANAGSVTVQATKGEASLRGTLGATVQSPATVSLVSSFVKVNVPTPFMGGVLTDGCIHPLTGRTYALSGSLGVPNFRVGP